MAASNSRRADVLRSSALVAMLVGVALGSASPAAAAPLRVMSLNECADQLVLALLPSSRITSVSWISRDPEGSQMWRAARRVRVNHGLAEEVLRDRPDLVVAGTYTTPALRALLASLHYRMLVLPPADSFADIRRSTLEVASAVGETARGRALVAHLDAVLADLAADKGPSLRVAAWDAAGFSASPGSLYDTLLKAAGARNVTAQAHGAGASAPDVEALLAAAPQLLVAGAPALQTPGLRTEAVHSPLARRFWGDRTLVVPLAAYNCGTPFSADAALSLRRQMRAMAARARTALPYRAAWAR